MTKSKIIIIGCCSDSDTARNILEKIGDKEEVVFYVKREDVPISEIGDVIQVQKFNSIHRLIEPTINPVYFHDSIPKRKGHERPYKYHR